MSKSSTYASKSSKYVSKSIKYVSKRSTDVSKCSKEVNKSSKYVSKSSKDVRRSSKDVSKSSTDVSKSSKMRGRALLYCRVYFVLVHVACLQYNFLYRFKTIQRVHDRCQQQAPAERYRFVVPP